MPRLIVPIGLMFGPSYTEDSPDEPEEFVVGRAGGPRKLDGPRWQTWLLAHGTRGEAADLGTTHAALVGKAAHLGIEGARSVIGRLLDDGDVAELDTDYGKQRDFFSAYRLKPLAFGYGNDPEDRSVSWIGRPGDEQAVKVPSEVQFAWEAGLTDSSTWERIEFLAERRARRPRESFPHDPDRIGQVVAEFLPLLIAEGCAFLDDGDGRLGSP
jgi:hypothetical protein